MSRIKISYTDEEKVLSNMLYMDIAGEAKTNEFYRHIRFNVGNNFQVVLMSIHKTENVPREKHDYVQLVNVVEGVGEIIFNDNQIVRMVPGSAVVIPVNRWHEIRNVGKGSLKLYTIYSGKAHSRMVQLRQPEEGEELSEEEEEKEEEPPQRRPPARPSIKGESHKDLNRRIDSELEGANKLYIKIDTKEFERQKGIHLVKAVSGQREFLEFEYYNSKIQERDDVVARLFAPATGGIRPKPIIYEGRDNSFPFAGQAVIKKKEKEYLGWIETAIILKSFRGRKLCTSLVFYAVNYFLTRISRGSGKRKARQQLLEGEEEEEEQEGVRDELVIDERVPQFHVWIKSSNPIAARECYTRALERNGYFPHQYRGEETNTLDYYNYSTSSVENMKVADYDSKKHGEWSEVLIFVRGRDITKPVVRNSEVVSKERGRLQELARKDKNYKLPAWTKKEKITMDH